MACFMQRTSVGAVWRQRLTGCSMKLLPSITRGPSIHYIEIRHLNTKPIPLRRPLDPDQLRSLQATDGNLRLRFGVAQDRVDLEVLAQSLKSKIHDPTVKAELIVIQLELLYIACRRLKSHWDPNMQYVAQLGAGKAVLEWLWSDLDQWSEAVELYAFTKHLCFFLVAEGLEYHIWEMLENGDLQRNVSYQRQHVWRGVLFRSFVQAKTLIGHSLHQSMDDALATLFVLEQKKRDQLAQPTIMRTSKFQAEVGIVMDMQSPLSAKTNPVLWDKFYECYTSKTPRVKYGFERKVAVIRLFHPERPNPWPAYRYIMRHVAENHPLPIGAGNRETAIEFALAVWMRLLEVLQARGCPKNIARLESLWEQLDFKDRILQIPKASDKPLSREGPLHTPRQRSRHQIRIDPDREDGEEEEENYNIVDIGNFPAPLQWQEKQKGRRGSYERYGGLGSPPVPERPKIKMER